MVSRELGSLRVLLIAAILATLLAGPGRQLAESASALAQSVSSIDESSDWIPGQVIVRYRATTSTVDRASILSQHRATLLKSIDQLDMHLLRTTPGEEITTIGRLRADPRIQFAEPNYRVRASAVPTDPRYVDQWDMPLIGMESAWNTSTGSGNVVTAVIDTGIDFNHPDLAGRIVNLSGPGLPGADHVFVSDPSPTCAPVNSPDDDAWTGSAVAHGTHVAGTIAANSTLSGGPAVGVTGVAPSTRVAPLKALDCEGSGATFDIAAAITFAANHTAQGVRVINMSLGSSGDSTACRDAYLVAINLAFSNGIFIAAAMGNDGSTNRSNPAICPNVVGVGSTTAADTISPFSQHNSFTDLSAPGSSILSTIRTSSGAHDYTRLNGTSMATPHVAGCAALIRSVDTSLTPSQVETLLRNTAVDLGTPGRDDFFGSGRINCGAAVAAALGGPPPPTDTPLSSAVPLTGQSVGQGQMRFYSINVPTGSTQLLVQTTAATGDVDLYTRSGQKPTLTAYDCRPFTNSGNETCTHANPAAGTWWIAVYGYAAGTFTITATVTTPSATPTELQNGVPLTGQSVALNQMKFYSINVPSGASQLVVQTMNATGDADLYTRFGSQPTLTTYACRPYTSSGNESCTHTNPSAGTWFIGVNGYTAASYTILASYTTAATDMQLTNGVPVTGQTVALDQMRFYFIDVPAGTSELQVRTTNATGDADLYTRFGSKPTLTTYACRPYTGSGNETCTHANPSAGTWWIGVYGYAAASYTITASFTSTSQLTNGVPLPNQNVALGQMRIYTIAVPAGAGQLQVQTTNATGDADLYTRFGSAPTLTAYDCRPYTSSGNEVCTHTSPAAGTWYIGVNGYSAATYTITATFTTGPASTVLQNGVPLTGQNVALDQMRLYTIDVPTGATELQVRTTNATGDADLYTRFGSAPTLTTYACRPYTTSGNETCTHANPPAGTWWIGVHGYTAATYTITATFSAAAGPTQLTSGVPLTGQSVALNEMKLYSINVPAGMGGLRVQTTNATGDADLYTRFGSAPTLTTYACRPYTTSGNETCIHNSPAPGTWYIGVHGYTAATYTITATFAATPFALDETGAAGVKESTTGAAQAESVIPKQSGRGPVPEEGQPKVDPPAQAQTAEADVPKQPRPPLNRAEVIQKKDPTSIERGTQRAPIERPRGEH